VRILLLDDNLMTSARLVNFLRSRGCEVLLARQLPDQSTFVFDWVILNLGSRSMNGIGLLTQAQSTFPDAKTAGFCGHLEIEIRRAAKAAGIGHLMTNEQVAEQLEKLLHL
jgi:DNA-binding NarL/FixJ family response regulator